MPVPELFYTDATGQQQTSPLTDNNAATLLKFELRPGQTMRRIEEGTTAYHVRALVGTADATAAWEVLRLVETSASGVTTTRADYREDVKLTELATGWWDD